MRRRAWLVVLLPGLAAGCMRAGFETGPGRDGGGGDLGRAEARSDQSGDRVRDQRAPDAHFLSDVTVRVPAQCNIYGAGHSIPPAPGGLGAGQLPAMVALPAVAERFLVLTAVSGTINRAGPDDPISPDVDLAGRVFGR